LPIDPWAHGRIVMPRPSSGSFASVVLADASGFAVDAVAW
jgi:hypothetical protein